MLNKKILITEYIDDVGRNYLLERGYELKKGTGMTKEAITKDIVDCDGLIMRVLLCDKDVLAAGNKLKVIAKHGIGVDSIDVGYCTEHGIQITFTPAANSNTVAEHALYHILACAKNGFATSKLFREQGDFETRNKLIGVELVDKTVGILGLGRIGRALAHKCMGIGMKAIGYDPYITQEQVGPEIRLFDNRDEVFKNADFVSLHLPCTPETRGSISMREFKLMKKSAFFINVSRGGVVVEKDLIEALKTGVICGAGIDVF